MDRYYKVDIRRLPMALIWQWGNRAGLLLFAIRRLLPVPWFGPVLVPAEPILERVPEGEADERLLQAVAPASEYFTESGFQSVTCYSVPTLGTGRGLAHALLSRDGRVIALCVVSRSGTLQETSVSLVSQATDGQLIGTGSAVRRLPKVPHVDGLSIPGAPPSRVLGAHSDRIAGRSVRALRAEDVVPTLLDLQARSVRHYLATKLYVPATHADIQAARHAAEVNAD